MQDVEEQRSPEVSGTGSCDGSEDWKRERKWVLGVVERNPNAARVPLREAARNVHAPVWSLARPGGLLFWGGRSAGSTVKVFHLMKKIAFVWQRRVRPVPLNQDLDEQRGNRDFSFAAAAKRG